MCLNSRYWIIECLIFATRYVMYVCTGPSMSQHRALTPSESLHVFCVLQQKLETDLFPTNPKRSLCNLSRDRWAPVQFYKRATRGALWLWAVTICFDYLLFQNWAMFWKLNIDGAQSLAWKRPWISTVQKIKLIFDCILRSSDQCKFRIRWNSVFAKKFKWNLISNIFKLHSFIRFFSSLTCLLKTHPRKYWFSYS